MSKVTSVDVYTDGSCTGQGPGGWAAVLYMKDSEGKLHTTEIHGGDLDTTISRMEMVAVIKALRFIKMPCHVNVFTDRPLVAKGYNYWLRNWNRYGWVNREGNVISNVDLWKSMERAAEFHTAVAIGWIRGHAGDIHNERADLLAKAARQEVIDSIHEEALELAPLPEIIIPQNIVIPRRKMSRPIRET